MGNFFPAILQELLRPVQTEILFELQQNITARSRHIMLCTPISLNRILCVFRHFPSSNCCKSILQSRIRMLSIRAFCSIVDIRSEGYGARHYKRYASQKIRCHDERLNGSYLSCKFPGCHLVGGLRFWDALVAIVPHSPGGLPLGRTCTPISV